jgi:glycosyltransferase involved in cell wall biosynthesis
MKLSVIIPCYNAVDTIAEQLEALATQEWSEPWEIIVADNRSTDDSIAIVKQYQERLPNLRLIDASARQGQPYALNAGVKAAVGEALAFCDADDVVGSGWVAAMGAALSKYDFVACRFDTLKLNEGWLYKSRRNPQRDGLQEYDYPPYLHHAGGGSLGVKRALYEAIDGFDETLPYLHDTDFYWRLQLAGTELHFVSDAVIHIRYRDTLRSIYRQARNYGEYNVILYKKYRPLGMPELSWRTGVTAWFKLLRWLLRIRSKTGLAKWTWQFGWLTGRLQGSLRHRVQVAIYHS